MCVCWWHSWQELIPRIPPNPMLQEDQVAADEGPSRKRVLKNQSTIVASPSKLARMDHTAGECICCSGCAINICTTLDFDYATRRQLMCVAIPTQHYQYQLTIDLHDRCTIHQVLLIYQPISIAPFLITHLVIVVHICISIGVGWKKTKEKSVVVFGSQEWTDLQDLLWT